MSNHYHVVLHLRPDSANQWTEHDVVSRWHRLFNGTFISQQYLNGEPLAENQTALLVQNRILTSLFKGTYSAPLNLRYLSSGLTCTSNLENSKISSVL